MYVDTVSIKSFAACYGERLLSCRNKLVDVVSGVPQGSVLDQLLYLLYTSELFHILENKLIGYGDDNSLIAVVPSPGVRVTVAEFLKPDLVEVSE